MRTPSLRWTKPVDAESPRLEAIVIAPPPSLVMDPPMAPRDEMIFLLQVAAEVEQSLLVQYLYAAFSIRQSNFPTEAPVDAAEVTGRWYQAIFQTAKEEMGHLLTVQNIMNYLGGPLTLDREDCPFRSDFYPFHFRLQPLRRKSLAKYVAAEKPDPVVGLTQDEQADLDKLLKLVAADETVSRVGRVYDRLIQLASQLTPADVRPDRDRFQHEGGSWR